MKNIILASKRFIKKAVASFSTKKKKKMLAVVVLALPKVKYFIKALRIS